MTEKTVARLEHVLGGGGGRGFTIFEDDRLALAARGMHEHEASAADIAGRRIRDRQCERGRNRSIDSVAALLENRHTDIDARRRYRDHDAVTAFRRFLI